MQHPEKEELVQLKGHYSYTHTHPQHTHAHTHTVPADSELQGFVRTFHQCDGFLSVSGQLHIIDDDDLIPHLQWLIQTVHLTALLHLQTQKTVKNEWAKRKGLECFPGLLFSPVDPDSTEISPFLSQ